MSPLANPQGPEEGAAHIGATPPGPYVQVLAEWAQAGHLPPSTRLCRGPAPALPGHVSSPGRNRRGDNQVARGALPHRPFPECV